MLFGQVYGVAAAAAAAAQTGAGLVSTRKGEVTRVSGVVDKGPRPPYPPQHPNHHNICVNITL